MLKIQFPSLQMILSPSLRGSGLKLQTESGVRRTSSLPLYEGVD